ncbi:MAG: AMP-binding enzyme family protein [Herminiimonas sp.]|nr:AMP-binding enzyme family protein [Herminiimonas sp.]MDB5853910.1 AMP-binding enzyme family protein [Herminiimonas sp.]
MNKHDAPDGAFQDTAAPVLAWARRQPNAPALSDGTMALSYGQLADAVEATMHTLQSMGVCRGSRVLAVGENSVPLAVFLLAASRLGVIAVLENARRVAPEIRSTADHCLPSHLFFLYAESSAAESHALTFGAQEFASDALGRFGVAAGAQPESKADACSQDMPQDVALIIYTTGTTGQPKGVMLTHGNLCYIASMMVTLRRMTPLDRVYGVLPITHVMGHASVFLGALHAGASLHLAARFSAEKCVDALLRHRITALQGATAMFAKIAEHCAANGFGRFDTIRFIGSGGAPIDPTVKKQAEALFGCTLQNGYGLTEAASICWTRFEEANDDDSVGRPLPGVEISFRNSDRTHVMDGEVGELWVRGPNLMRGYFRNPDAKRSLMDDAGWFNTQDLGRVEADGRVFIVGRTKDVIIRSGFKVYPLEVEAVLNAHPAVLQAAVVGRALTGNEEVLAFVELAEGAIVTEEQLLLHVAQRLSPYKRPARVLILPVLPLAANGKVLKYQLLQSFADENPVE